MAKLGPILLLLLPFFLCGVFGHREEAFSYGLVSKDRREILALSEVGSISAVDVRDGARGAYHIQFITMEPGSLFLPVLLHSDMVFYVHSGRGSIKYIEEEDHEDENKDKEKGGGTKSFDLERGDVSRLKEGTTFYIRSSPDPTRQKLRIHAIFNTIENSQDQFSRAYSNISDLVRGFDERVLQMGFGVSQELIQSIKWAERSPPIVPDTQRNETEEERDNKSNNINWKEGIIESVVGVRDPMDYLNKKKSKDKDRTFNFYSGKPDVKNCYGWSRAVTHKDLKALKRSDIGAFMVNLTTGSMMGPHWNPRATEISIVTHGQGMIQIICPTNPPGQPWQPESQFTCQNSFFRVKEGDIFIVPKFHPMAQISFNNDSFVFVGFTTNARKNYPQFLAGGRSVLNVIDRDVLARAFNVMNESVIDEFLSKQKESIILECTSCAEDLAERVEEEARRREEEERSRREEEERKRREEEEAREREEEARRQQEEEERRRQQEEEEESRRQQEEEEQRRQQEEEQQRQQEEEQRRQQEEEEQRRQQKEEQRRQQEEEEQRRQEEEEEEEEERRRQQEEEEQRRQPEEEEQRRQQEEQGERTREEERRRQQEEEERTREEERIRQEEEEQARAQEQRRREEEMRRQQEEEEEEEEKRRREQEEETRREEEEQWGEGEEEGEEWIQGRKLWKKMRNKRLWLN